VAFRAGRVGTGMRTGGMNIVETTGLGKRYRRNWALRDCCLDIAEGRVAALVGPNGSGKTTLLNLTVGLITPTTGRVTVLGTEPAGSPAARDEIAFVAQDAPLYGNVLVRDMLRMTCYLNRRWDQRRAEQRLAELGIPLRRKAGKLSGGQQAQLALTLALARRPRLLVLDEPLSSLDPVSRPTSASSIALRSCSQLVMSWSCGSGAMGHPLSAELGFGGGAHAPSS